MGHRWQVYNLGLFKPALLAPGFELLEQTVTLRNIAFRHLCLRLKVKGKRTGEVCIFQKHPLQTYTALRRELF